MTFEWSLRIDLKRDPIGTGTVSVCAVFLNMITVFSSFMVSVTLPVTFCLFIYGVCPSAVNLLSLSLSPYVSGPGFAGTFEMNERTKSKTAVCA